MGTRADFYVGRGPDAEWLGSVTWDGYPDGFDTPFYRATSESQYRGAIMAVAKERNDWTSPEEGWPWPWETSRTSDYAYAYDDGKVYAAWNDCWWEIKPDDQYFGDPYSMLEDGHEYNSPEYLAAKEKIEKSLTRVDYPNMKDKQADHETIMKKSGLIVATSEGVIQ